MTLQEEIWDKINGYEMAASNGLTRKQLIAFIVKQVVERAAQEAERYIGDHPEELCTRNSLRTNVGLAIRRLKAEG